MSKRLKRVSRTFERSMGAVRRADDAPVTEKRQRRSLTDEIAIPLPDTSRTATAIGLVMVGQDVVEQIKLRQQSK